MKDDYTNNSHYIPHFNFTIFSLWKVGRMYYGRRHDLFAGECLSISRQNYRKTMCTHIAQYLVYIEEKHNGYGTKTKLKVPPEVRTRNMKAKSNLQIPFCHCTFVHNKGIPFPNGTVFIKKLVSESVINESCDFFSSNFVNVFPWRLIMHCFTRLKCFPHLKKMSLEPI